MAPRVAEIDDFCIRILVDVIAIQISGLHPQLEYLRWNYGN